MPKQLTRSVCVQGLTWGAGEILLLGLRASQRARAQQPGNVNALRGTWVNTNPNGVVAQVDISGSAGVGGTFDVHAYGFCVPTLCDWGAQPALRFSNNVESFDAVGFEVSIPGTSETDYMQGHLVKSASGQTALDYHSKRIRQWRPKKQLRSDRGFSSWFGRGRDDGARGGYEWRVDRNMGEYRDGWGSGAGDYRREEKRVGSAPVWFMRPELLRLGSVRSVAIQRQRELFRGSGIPSDLEPHGRNGIHAGALGGGARRAKLTGNHHADGVHRERGCSR
jgi:hypothetical protein